MNTVQWGAVRASSCKLDLERKMKIPMSSVVVVVVVVDVVVVDVVEVVLFDVVLVVVVGRS